MKNTLYILAGVATFANGVQASLSEKLAANQDQIEYIKSNIDSDDFLTQTKCSKSCASRCHNACGAR